MTVTPGSNHVAELLARHPHVSTVLPNSFTQGVAFQTREVRVGAFNLVQYGLLELMDNNPLVCATKMSIPDLAASLCLIALGPVLLSGLVIEAPNFITNLPINELEIQRALETVGWRQGITVQTDLSATTDVALATGMAVIQSLDDPEDLADLYMERFGKTCLIQLGTDLGWSPDFVVGKPVALFRISLVPDAPHSLVSVRVMCDRSGVFQAAQVINAMNIMLGLEDDLGIRA